MDQTTALADALLKTPSLLGGLLSQLGDSLDGTFTQNSMFSNLLSQNDDADASLTSLAQIPAATATTSLTPSSFSSSTSSTSSSSLLQNLGNLSSTLHKVLNLLRQQNGDSSSTAQNATTQTSSAAQTSSSQTATTQSQSAAQSSTQTTTQNGTDSQSGSQTSSTASTGSTTTASASATSSSDATSAADAGTQTDSTSTTGDAQMLAEIVAELLMLTQLMIKDLQTPTAGGLAAAKTGGTDGATASNGVNALALAATAAGTGSASSAASSGTTGDSTNPLMQLLTILQDTAQQLLPTSATASAGKTALDLGSLLGGKNDASALADIWTAASASAASATAQDTASAVALTAPLTIARQLSALDTGLKNVISAFQQSQTAAAKATSTQTDAAAVTGFTARAISDASAATTAKAPLSDTWQSQLYSILGGASSPQTPTSTAGQAFAAGAAFTISADKSSDGSGTGASSDDLTGNDNTAASLADFKSGASAEGTQATGTYNFASQLSAFRAANGGSTGLPSVVDQVILQMNRSVKSGNDQMSLQLQPGDMGKITVKLDFASDGKVQGTVVADNPKTLEMLQKDSRSLERALQDAGLRADPGSLQFSLGGQQNQNNAGQNADNSGAAADDGTENALNATDGSVDLASLDASAETYYVTPSGVNIRV